MTTPINSTEVNFFAQKQIEINKEMEGSVDIERLILKLAQNLIQYSSRDRRFRLDQKRLEQILQKGNVQEQVEIYQKKSYNIRAAAEVVTESIGALYGPGVSKLVFEGLSKGMKAWDQYESSHDKGLTTDRSYQQTLHDHYVNYYKDDMNKDDQTFSQAMRIQDEAAKARYELTKAIASAA